MSFRGETSCYLYEVNNISLLEQPSERKTFFSNTFSSKNREREVGIWTGPSQKAGSKTLGAERNLHRRGQKPDFRKDKRAWQDLSASVSQPEEMLQVPSILPAEL